MSRNTSSEIITAQVPEEQAKPNSLWSLTSFLPSFSQVANISHAYYNFGAAYAVPLAGSSVVDSYFSTTFGGRNYASLTAFWGGVSYKAIKLVQDAKLSPTAKLSLTVLIPAIAGYMVFRGTDIFKDETNLTETFKSVKLTASFFDESKAIPQIEDGFKEGYTSGAFALYKNSGSLASNKFIRYAIAEQASYFVTSFIVQKYLSNIPLLDKAAIALAEKSGVVTASVKDGLFRLVKFAVDAAHGKISTLLQNSIKHEIDIKMGHLLLESDTETILRLREEIKTLPTEINLSYYTSSNSTSKLIELVCFNKVFSVKTSKGKIFYEEYPTLVLGEAGVEMVIDILKQITTFTAKFFNTSAPQDIEGTEETEMNLPGIACKFTTTSTPENYVHSKLQEIAKLGGNEFMLAKLVKYLNQKYKTGEISGVNSDQVAVINILKIVLSNIAFGLQTSNLDLPKDDTMLAQLDKCFGLFKAEGAIPENYTLSSIADKAMSTLKALRTKSDLGVQRTSGDSLILRLNDYDLEIKETSGVNRKMLHIEDLEFSPGKIYALYGKNGTGKTTLLTDIAACMDKAFSSKGRIEYPAIDSNKIPLVFCGSEAFAPPATTLLERLTYRLPEDYRIENEDSLLDQATKLFASFGHEKKFTKDLLKQKSNNDKLELSEGQKQLVTLIAAIIYKQYLKSPVVFVMDESMSKLDTDRGKGTEFEEGTVSKVHRVIKKVFADSIVISVDHYSQNYPQFYDVSINLQTYIPQQEAAAGVASSEAAVAPSAEVHVAITSSEAASAASTDILQTELGVTGETTEMALL